MDWKEWPWMDLSLSQRLTVWWKRIKNGSLAPSHQRIKARNAHESTHWAWIWNNDFLTPRRVSPKQSSINRWIRYYSWAISRCFSLWKVLINF